MSNVIGIRAKNRSTTGLNNKTQYHDNKTKTRKKIKKLDKIYQILMV